MPSTSTKDAHFPPESRPAYHYALFAHNSCAAGPGCGGACPKPADPSSAGLSELSGDDLIVSFGAYVDLDIPVRDVMVAGTLMHELGHNLLLRHSGDTDLPQNEPNYLSVMNPSYQFGIGETLLPGPYPTSPVDPSDGHRIDFSGENSLDEILGVLGPPASTDVIVFFADSGAVKLFAPSNGTPIDWDNDAFAGNPMAMADINGDGNLDILTGFDDWTSVHQSFLGLLLQFQCNAAAWVE
jgi:hypothetical protein